MKQTILVMLIAFNMTSQVQITEVTTKHLCAGDELTFKFKLTGSGTVQFNLVTDTINMAWTSSTNILHQIPMQSDSTRTKSYMTKSFLPIGWAYFSTDFSNDFPIYIQCTATGIIEESMSDEIIYLPLFGPIEIKKQGNKYTKVIRYETK